jgi:hypothetical protein
LSLLLAAAPWTVTAQTASPAPEPTIASPVCTAEQEPNDQPEQAPSLSSAICLTGELPELRDQDLLLWEVEPAEALITWRFTIEGIPTTITSLYLFVVQSEPGVFPIDARQLFRIDSSATGPEPGVSEGVSLRAGRYLIGISRGDPAKGPPAPAAEYRATVEREQFLPATGDLEPNDDVATATPLTLPAALIGDAQGTPDVYRFSLSEADAARRWQLDVRAVQDDHVELALLRAADGGELARTFVPRDGATHLYDLALPAGEYLVRFEPGSGDAPLPYVLEIGPAPDAAADADPEPNDEPSQAVALSLGEPRTGRLAGVRDVDRYAVTIPAGFTEQVDAGIRVRAPADRQVCLIATDGRQVQCRRGQGDVVLSNLVLAPGDYQLQVDGDELLDDRYTVAVAPAGDPEAGREQEPNDDPATATPWDPALAFRGRSANGDVDWVRVTVDGEPQVWRLDVTGSQIRSVTWAEPDLELRGTADITPDGSQASLWDIAMVPGDHWFAIETRGEDWTMTLTPLGPRAAGSEREPNNDTANAEPVELGVPRQGRLPGPADADVFRFSTSVPEHVAIHLDPPVGTSIRMLLRSGGLERFRVREQTPGAPFDWVGELPPGEHELELTSTAGSVDPYTLLISRADLFTIPADLEPNDRQPLARPVPPTLVVEGSGFGAQGEDDDWYALPALAVEAPVAFTLEGEGAVLQELHDPVQSLRFERGEPGVYTTEPFPAGTELRVSVSAPGPYRLTVTSPGLTPTPEPDPLPVMATLTTATPEVAAYVDAGQQVEATLRLEHTGAEALALDLRAVTSHHAWDVSLGSAAVEVPAGGSVDVPVIVRIGKDPWADRPVRTSVRATAADGRGTTATLDIAPRRDTPAVAPFQAWSVPAPLLGGLDVASLALGATVPAPVTRSEPELHDGVAISSIGFAGTIARDEPLALTVDLAGEEAVPVAGFILNPLAGPAALATAPRAFEVQLSDDGASWTTVTAGELSPVGRDQAFALDAPITARFARLLLASTWGADEGGVWMGEWQVIADPAWQPPMAGFNLADPVLGGHVVWMDPGADDPRQPELMLSEEVDGRPWSPYLQGDLRVSWAIGFQDDRAAQLTRLEWVDAPGADPARRFGTVDVAVSTESALGPWQELGTWDLAQAVDGSVAPFVLPDGTWARFVRFSGAGPDETDYRDMPVVLRAFERPVGDGYRSVLGAWGRGESAAIAELTAPPDLAVLSLPPDVADGNDTPESAVPLVIGEPASGRLTRGRDVDWYTVTIPSDQNVLHLTLESPAEAGIVPEISTAGGAPVPIDGDAGGGRTSWSIEVEPGATYRIRLEQPPLSTVFTYDTSGSMGLYLSFVGAALRGFAADITPGQEAALVMPFEDPPLLDDWSDDPYAIESAVAGVASVSGSSASETSLLAALRELAVRLGARAILVVTDAETMSYNQGGELWRFLADVPAVIYTVHVAGSGAPALTTDLMQDWAIGTGGHYEYAVSHGEIDRAFDRLATRLRRPADYTLQADVSFVDRTPGRLTVSAPASTEGGPGLIAGTDVAVSILLDTSGSMNAKLGKRTRIAVAKAVLDRLVTETLPDGVPTALRIFKAGKKSCDTQLLTPLGPLDGASMAQQVRDLRIDKGTKTPLGTILLDAVDDLGGATGTAIVVLITDGAESCGGDPAASIQALRDSGLDVRVNIVGFDIDDAGLKEQLRAWAEAGGGQAFDADSPDALADGLAQSLAAPFRVLDPAGAVVGTGVVGDGQEIILAPGTYRVEVLTDPPIVIDPVEIAPGAGKVLEVRPEASPTP